MGLLFLVGLPGVAQVFPGGGIGYPGGGIGFPGGGIGFPGRRRNPNQNMPTQNFLGLLQQISTNSLTVLGDDKTTSTIMLTNRTSYVKESGSRGRNSDFAPGDRVSVDAFEDNNNNFEASKVTQIRVGTADDKAAAAKGSTTTSSSAPPSDDDDPDRPRLHRADSNISSNNPPSSSGSSSSSSNASNSGDSSSSASSSSTTSRPAPRDVSPSSDPDDSGPPLLRRGRPQQASSSSDSDSQSSQSASSRPSIHAEEVNGVTQAPPPPRVDDTRASLDPNSGGNGGFRPLPRDSGDPVIEQAREAVFSFSETLPNYVVKQYTTRFATDTATGGKTSWQALDNVTADVIMENGAERYKNILVNGRPPRDAIEKTGSWSSGEFSSLMQDVFSTPTNADFHGKRSTTIANRNAWRYDFSVEQPNSHWHVETGNQTFLPAYSGTVWIDKETSRVLRIEMQAEAMPRTFPLDTVESAVDYDFVMIGDAKFLLPVHSEALSCERGTRQCSRNVIDFRNYRKFTSESSVTFDSNQ